MLRIKRIIIVVLMLVIMVLSVGCNPMQLIEEEDVRADVDAIVHAVENEDSEFIYNTYFKDNVLDIKRDEVEKGMRQIIGLYRGEIVSTEYYHVNVRSFGGETTKDVMYLIMTTQSTYYLKLTYLKDAYGTYNLIGINIDEYLDYVVNSKMSDYTLKNWILLFINITSYAIMIAALVLCIKTKQLKLKPLWILLILIQVGVTIVDFPNTYRVNFSIFQLLGISQYLLYAHGGTVTNVFIHVFAIVFLLIRERLPKKNTNYDNKEYSRIIAERQERVRIEKNESVKQEQESDLINKE